MPKILYLCKSQKCQSNNNKASLPANCIKITIGSLTPKGVPSF